MPRSVDATAKRRKLLGEIERLAEIAVFGTLSQSYRTCGRKGCHCQSGGPKHGPHLNVSYRGEKGKTTGYYVPKEAEEATREGVAAWQQIQQYLRELAELNKERNLRQARGLIRNDAMVPSRSLLLATAVSVTQSYSAGRPEPPVAGCRLRTMARSSKRMCGRQAHRIGHQEHGIRSASCSIVFSIQVDSRQSCSIRPETMGHRNRSRLAKLPVKPATPTNAIEHRRKYRLNPPIFKIRV